MAPATAARLTQLRRILGDLDSVVVAFSGGTDSAFLAWMANDTLGSDRATAVTAVSPSLAGEELDDCRALAAEWGLSWLTVETDEMANAAYRINDTDRCYWCKDALMAELVPVAARFDATVVLGVNLDDLDDHRPGQRAASERGAAFPLVDAGFDKSAIRNASYELGLRTWDKPAAACLASRLPYGTEVRLATLTAVERAERSLHRIGFASLRVRHYGTTARIEVPIADIDRLIACRRRVVEAVKAAGYRYVTVDLEGLRSGNLNDGAAPKHP